MEKIQLHEDDLETLKKGIIKWNPVNYNITQLKEKLSKGHSYFFNIFSEKNKEKYLTRILFWRLDTLRDNMKSKYKKEKYLLGIEASSVINFDEEGPMDVDKTIKFDKIEELIDYLVENKYVKNSEIIKEG